MNNARVALAIGWKDFSIWLRRPVAIISTMIPTVMYVLVVYYISVDVATPPIAAVSPVRSPASERFVTALRSDGGFRVDVMSATQAKQALATMKVAAVVTIPPALSGADATDTRTNAPVQVGFKLNNLNADIANDVRRSLALSIKNYNAATGSPAPVVTAQQNTYTQDISLARFRLLPGLVLILSIAGIVNTGLATCQEFETKTFKELVLAPAPNWILVAGKVLGGWLTTLLIAAFIWAIGFTTGLIAPTGVYIAPAIAMSLLVGLAACCIGVAIGAALRKFQLVTSLSVTTALYLFFAAGGVSVFGFLPHLLQQVTAFDPMYYAIQGLLQTVLFSSTHQYLRDVAVMLGFGLAAAAVSTVVVRRRVAE
jgi:ABC-type multidrug transport system permease subunit